MALHVGTSGWAYPEWRGVLYPPRLPQGDFLSFYGETLGACEVNATFYRVQPLPVLERWAAAVPPSFRFTVKAHRRVTYRKQLAPDAGTEAFVEDFLTSIAALGDKLGCLLLQMPEFAERDDAGLTALLDLLPDRLPFACEFLNASWWSPDVGEALAARGGTVCVREEEGYDDGARQALRELLEREAAERDVYAFARHKDVSADDPHTGLGLARWLIDAVGASP